MDAILTKSVEITLQGKKVALTFPNIKQQIQIETAKQTLTDGRYALMAFSGMKSTNDLLDIVDTLAFFSALIPKIYDIIGVSDHEEFMALPMDSKIVEELVFAYKTEYQPWFNKRYERVDRPKAALGIKKSEDDKEGSKEKKPAKKQPPKQEQPEAAATETDN